jgi:aspartate kinase
MKVLKFGGTSVGSAERMKEVARLVNRNEKQIVVLSAMSGTTNSLVQIAENLYAKKNSKVNQLINQLEKKYKQVVFELFSDFIISKEASALIDSHFNYIRSFTQDLFTIHEERAILAQGELISTALFHLYLQ